MTKTKTLLNLNHGARFVLPDNREVRLVGTISSYGGFPLVWEHLKNPLPAYECGLWRTDLYGHNNAANFCVSNFDAHAHLDTAYTKNGWRVNIFTRKAEGAYPIVGQILQGGVRSTTDLTIYKWRADGRSGDCPYPFNWDLIL